MFEGKLEAIFIGAAKAGPMQQVDHVQAVAGDGVEGNRYSTGGACLAEGAKPKAGQQVTLIESEAIEAAARDYGIAIDAAQSRRNLLVRGVPLNHLVGKEFLVGAVRMRGIRLCEPCGHLEQMTVPGIEQALLHRGGLRAVILSTGTLQAGDKVSPG
jgi:MOSC domain-containing protein YiiM